MYIEISLMGRVTKFLLDQILENIMKFTQAHYDTSNSVQPNLEHWENIDRIHDADYACTIRCCKRVHKLSGLADVRVHKTKYALFLMLQCC